MFKSIRSLLYLSFVIIGISLALVIALGFRQYRLSNQYSEIIILSERTLFGFGTIRDQVTELMISADYAQIKSIIPDIEQLNTNVLSLYDNKVIPAQYKLAMADTIDLSGLVIGLRKLEAAAENKAANLEIQQELRQIGENLIKVDRIITTQIRDSVIGFQLSIIGTMGILISCASFILIVLYRRGVMPLLELSNQVAPGKEVEKQQFDCSSEAGVEIVSFVESVNEMLAKPLPSDYNRKQLDGAELDLLSKTVNETTNNLNAVINYAELLLESGPEELSSEQRQMIRKIVESGERIGDHWQNISQGFDR